MILKVIPDSDIIEQLEFPIPLGSRLKHNLQELLRRRFDFALMRPQENLQKSLNGNSSSVAHPRENLLVVESVEVGEVEGLSQELHEVFWAVVQAGLAGEALGDGGVLGGCLEGLVGGGGG